MTSYSHLEIAIDTARNLKLTFLTPPLTSIQDVHAQVLFVELLVLSHMKLLSCWSLGAKQAGTLFVACAARF